MHTTTHFSGISGSTLKLIAVITMFIDHAGATVIRAISQHPAIYSVPEQRMLWAQIYRISRNVGRIAFPIFCFLIVEGFLHTRNVRRYAERLFLFALVSELPFDLALKGSWYFPQKQNVYFTLLIGLLVLIGFRQIAQYPWAPADHAETGHSSVLLHLRHALWIPILAAGMYLALWIDTDYSYKGVFLIAVLYLTHHEKLFQCIGGAVSVAWEIPAPVAFIPVWLYNGTRGLKLKYFFYWFYPVHLLVLHMITVVLVPAILG